MHSSGTLMHDKLGWNAPEEFAILMLVCLKHRCQQQNNVRRGNTIVSFPMSFIFSIRILMTFLSIKLKFATNNKNPMQNTKGREHKKEGKHQDKTRTPWRNGQTWRNGTGKKAKGNHKFNSGEGKQEHKNTQGKEGRQHEGKERQHTIWRDKDNIKYQTSA